MTTAKEAIESMTAWAAHFEAAALAFLDGYRKPSGEGLTMLEASVAVQALGAKARAAMKAEIEEATSKARKAAHRLN